MKLVMNMVRKPFKQGDVIFETSERSDELYLIHTGSVEIRSREGLVLATLKQGELFGEMASIMGERAHRTIAGAGTVIDVIDATTMQRKLGEADPVLRALIRNLTFRLADANRMNEERWQQLNIYRSLTPGKSSAPDGCPEYFAGMRQKMNVTHITVRRPCARAMPGPWPATTKRTAHAK